MEFILVAATLLTGAIVVYDNYKTRKAVEVILDNMPDDQFSDGYLAMLEAAQQMPPLEPVLVANSSATNAEQTHSHQFVTWEAMPDELLATSIRTLPCANQPLLCRLCGHGQQCVCGTMEVNVQPGRSPEGTG